MFGRAVSRTAPRSSYVCINCRCGIHTTSSAQYPRAPPGTRAPPARRSAAPRPDRPAFTRSSPGFSNDRNERPSFARAPATDRGDTRFKDRASPRKSDRPQFDASRSPPSRFTENRGSNADSPSSAARFSSPQRAPRDDVRERSARGFTQDWSPARSRGGSRSSPSASRSGGYGDRDNASSGFAGRESRFSSRPDRDGSSGRSTSDFARRPPQAPDKYGRPDRPFLKDRSSKDFKQDTIGTQRGLRDQHGSGPNRASNGYSPRDQRSTGSSRFSDRSTGRFGSEAPSPRYQDRGGTSSRSSKYFGRSVDTDGPVEVRRNRLTPSLNSRVPSLARRSDDKDTYSSKDDSPRRSSSERFSSPTRSSRPVEVTSPKSSYSEHGPDSSRGRPRLDVSRPMSEESVAKPISRAEHALFNAKKNLNKQAKIHGKWPHLLSNTEVENAERWKSPSKPSQGSASGSSSSRPRGPRGLAARVIEGSKSLQESVPQKESRFGIFQPSLRFPETPQESAASARLGHMFTPQTFASYKSTIPPTTTQLSYANKFFTSGNPSYLFSSDKFRELPLSSVPEVVFLGRSNVGKSSLLNALVHRTGLKLANISSKPGRTRTMNAFGVGGEGGVRWSRTSVKEKSEGEEGEGAQEQQRDTWIGKGGLVVLDMPGYGKGSRETWGKEIMKYLHQRKQ